MLIHDFLGRESSVRPRVLHLSSEIMDTLGFSTSILSSILCSLAFSVGYYMFLFNIIQTTRMVSKQSATKDCPNFLSQVLSTLGQSKNPEIHYFQKLPNKNFKVLLKRFLLGSYDLPGFLDFWIIIIT